MAEMQVSAGNGRQLEVACCLWWRRMFEQGTGRRILDGRSLPVALTSSAAQGARHTGRGEVALPRELRQRRRSPASRTGQTVDRDGCGLTGKGQKILLGRCPRWPSEAVRGLRDACARPTHLAKGLPFDTVRQL